MLKNLVFKILFISWMVFVTFSSLCSFEGMQSGRFNFPHVDKVVHFVFYFIMVITGFFAVKSNYGNRFGTKKILLGILIFAILYGIIIEVLQFTMTTDRHGDILDALANSVGAIMGVLLTRLLIYRGRSLK